MFEPFSYTLLKTILLLWRSLFYLTGVMHYLLKSMDPFIDLGSYLIRYEVELWFYSNKQLLFSIKLISWFLCGFTGSIFFIYTLLLTSLGSKALLKNIYDLFAINLSLSFLIVDYFCSYLPLAVLNICLYLISLFNYFSTLSNSFSFTLTFRSV